MKQPDLERVLGGETSSVSSWESADAPGGEQPKLGPSITQVDLESAAAAVQSILENLRRQVAAAAEEQKSAAIQQSIYFWLSVAGAVAGVAIVLYGGYLVLRGQADVGVITGMSGAVPGVISVLLFKRADAAEKRRERSAERARASIDKWHEIERVVQVAARLPDKERQIVLALLALAEVFPQSKPGELSALFDSTDREAS